MVTETDRTVAPYAPINHVLNVIRRFRERGLPNPLTLQELERVGVPPSNAPRTLAALRFVGLINDEGERTSEFERIGRASTEEYPGVLDEIVKAAYAPVFTVVDPAENSDIEIQDAFRHYQPQTQRGRMVSLFLGLCREAGIVPGGPLQRRTRRRRTIAGTQPSATGTLTDRPEPVGVHAEVPEPTVTQTEAGIDFRLVSALMQQLPKDGKWTKAKRDKWVEAVSASIDLLTDIIEKEEDRE